MYTLIWQTQIIRFQVQNAMEARYWEYERISYICIRTDSIGLKDCCFTWVVSYPLAEGRSGYDIQKMKSSCGTISIINPDSLARLAYLLLRSLISAMILHIMAYYWEAKGSEEGPKCHCFRSDTVRKWLLGKIPGVDPRLRNEWISNNIKRNKEKWRAHLDSPYGWQTHEY